MSDAQSPQVTPEQPLSVTLSIAQWRAVLEQLSAGPFRVVAPLMGDIERQAQAAIARLQQPGMPMPIHRSSSRRPGIGNLRVALRP